MIVSPTSKSDSKSTSPKTAESKVPFVGRLQDGPPGVSLVNRHAEPEVSYGTGRNEHAGVACGRHQPHTVGLGWVSHGDTLEWMSGNVSRLRARPASLPHVDNLPSGFDPDFHAEMQRRAREEFPAFFAVATPREAQIMDAAYVGARAYRQAVETPRPGPADPVRHPLEIVTNNAEQLLLHVRDALRNSDAYRQLPDDERARIDRRLFG